MRTTHFAGAVQLLCLVFLGAAAGTAHRLEKRAEKDDQTCWPKKLGYPRIKLRTFGITVHWNHFSPKSDCLENKANYVINITWVVEDQLRYEQTVPVEQDKFTIGSLSPWTKVDILVSLCYTDRDGKESCGEADDWNTRTSEGHPSKPRTFKVSEVDPNVTTLAFEDPENPNGPLDGYTYEVCKVNSCAEKTLRGFCGTLQELKRHQHTFHVEGLAPLEYYMIHIWAYNKDYILKKKLDGEYAQLCIRSPPSVVELIRGFDVTCRSGSNSVNVVWNVASNSQYIPEGYQVAVGKLPDRQDMENPVHDVNMKAYDVNMKTSCEGELCRYSVGGCDGGAAYMVQLYPFYKDVNPLRDYVVRRICHFPPPLPDKEIQVVDDPELDKTQQAIQMPDDMFDEFGVSANESRMLLVAQDSQIDDCSRPESWNWAHTHDPVKCYSLDLSRGEEYGLLCNKTGNIVRCVLGTGRDCEIVHCNGPLKMGVRYGVKLRVMSEGGYIDSKPVFFTAGSPSIARKLTHDPVHEVPSSTRGTLSSTHGLTDATVYEIPTSTAGTLPSIPGSGVRDGGSLFLIGGIVVLTFLLVRT